MALRFVERAPHRTWYGAFPGNPWTACEALIGTLRLMTTLVLTVVGADRAGLVAAVADVVDAHGGNWENSQLAELPGAFAGIIEVSVAHGSRR